MSRLLVLLAAAFVLALAGCGGDSDDSADGGGGGKSGGAFPAKVEHKYGTTTVEQAPKRIVVAGYREQDAVLALGAVPVAVTKWLKLEINPWAEKYMEGKKKPAVLSAADGIDVEAIAAQRPDLIVGVYSGITKEQYETLSKLAPVIAPPAGVPEYGSDFRMETMMTGEAMGRKAQAEELVKGVDDKIAALREKYPQFEGKSASAATLYKGISVFGRDDPRNRLLTEMGFSVPKALDRVTGNKFFATISDERTDLIDTDVLLWQVQSGTRKDVTKNPAIAGLSVTKRGAIVFSEPGTDDDALTYSSVLSLPVALDALVPKFAKAVGEEDQKN